ncbi:spermatogenesis-associated protein 2-like protein isoform X2 [Neolamprologus brichardi]|uniref:spermatogenesis-associated protein 2-like protein isoform X2 n=1 Tax=Neolamprologus brichardi TaxID=32507 RepID=UPI001643D4A0|nr:spermatogenesis-associated protein 2-like protein isoform X2 [Neolamprologus brichardi]
MSFSRKRDVDLTGAYDRSLERQIAERGSSLPCRDEELWRKVEGLMKEGNAQKIHCLGVDPLRVMEESLKAVTAAGWSRRVGTRGGLQGLAKAFEVLEQAALNLYLASWRKEYAVIQMYSGTFTHYITPVLSTAQIENLFNLLGYELGASSSEQLHLQTHRVNSTSSDTLLRLSCAFFLARCECHFLTTVLGKRCGDTQWELSAVMERQRGNGLQVAVENTKKMLEVGETLMEQPDGDVDLYTDPVNEEDPQMVVNNEESPCSFIWTTADNVSPTTVQTHSNGTTASFPQREPLTGRNSSDSKRPSWRSPGATRLSKTNTEPQSLQVDPIEALKSEDGDYNLCRKNVHNVKQVKKMPSGGLRSPTLTGSSAAVSSLPLSEDPASIIALPPAIAYHECCDLKKPDPQILCHVCRVFHSKSCNMAKSCQSHHGSTQLGQCSSCDKWCSRKPLVLCRYCGNEYCSACWFRNPVTCRCGQTFDQSTSV